MGWLFLLELSHAMTNLFSDNFDLSARPHFDD